MPSKAVPFRPSPSLYVRMDEERAKMGFVTMAELVEECVRYYLDRELYAIRDKKELEKIFIDSLRSDEGRIALSRTLDEVLDERARRKYGEEL